MNASTTAAGERRTIEQVIQQYMSSGISGRGADKDATIFGSIVPDLFAGPIQGLCDWIDQPPPATGLQGAPAIQRASSLSWPSTLRRRVDLAAKDLDIV